MRFLTFFICVIALGALCAFSSGATMTGIVLCIVAVVLSGVSSAIEKGERNP